jgi:hypothetical protein
MQSSAMNQAHLEPSGQPMIKVNDLKDTLAYWNHVPENERTVECPPYLQGLSEKDQRILASWDSDFMEIPWDGEQGVKNLVCK